ncbi:MAG: hypothetical protein KF699_11085 [Phycisphaeraceae bacterium]|nr:hypothetical protein [Phycisphaeraceae bacterium]
MRRRLIMILALSLALGAAVNVGIALWVGRHSISNAAAWSGGYIGEWPAGARKGWPDGAIRAERSEELVREVAAWPVFDGWDPAVLPEIQPWQRVYESGWPWPAVRAQIAIPLRAERDVAPAQMPRAESGRSYRPIWPGFAYGTLLFGVLAGLVGCALLFLLGPWMLAFLLPRRRRRLIAHWRAWGVARANKPGAAGSDAAASAAESRPALGDAIAIAWWLSPRGSWKRLSGLIIAAVIGGAALTVLVSWTCALWPRVFVFQGFGTPMVIEQWGATFTSEQMPTGSPIGDMSALQVHVGWPWRTLRWTAENDAWARWAHLVAPPTSAPGIMREGVKLPSLLINAQRAERRIPLDPIAAGLVRAVPFYTAVSLVMLILLGNLRRGVRVWRGQCPTCGYPVGPPEVCTECGLPLRGNEQMANKQMAKEGAAMAEKQDR